jgi:hypothetical protein
MDAEADKIICKKSISNMSFLTNSYKMKNITILLLSLLLISCHQKNETITKTAVQHRESDSLDKIDIDKTIYCVYDLSKTTTAIVVNLNEKNTYNGAQFDKIFNQVNAKDSLYNVLNQDTAKVQNFEL